MERTTFVGLDVHKKTTSVAKLHRAGELTVFPSRPMTSFTTIAARDLRWFRRRSNRRYRCRHAAPLECRAFGGGPDLVLLVRHLARSALLYQPARLSAPLPADERMLAALFAIAIHSPHVVPVIEEERLALSPHGPHGPTSMSDTVRT